MDEKSLTDELIEVTENVWLGFTGHTPVLVAGADPGPGETVTSIVGIGGAFEGGVVLTTSADLATEVTGALFGTPDVELALVHDAVGELTNMLAGNLKVLVPGPSHLSLPVVTSGVQYHLSTPRATVLARGAFEVNDKVFTVELLRLQQGSELPGGGVGDSGRR